MVSLGRSKQLLNGGCSLQRIQWLIDAVFLSLIRIDTPASESPCLNPIVPPDLCYISKGQRPNENNSLSGHLPDLTLWNKHGQCWISEIAKNMLQKQKAITEYHARESMHTPGMTRIRGCTHGYHACERYPEWEYAHYGQDWRNPVPWVHVMQTEVLEITNNIVDLARCVNVWAHNINECMTSCWSLAASWWLLI